MKALQDRNNSLIQVSTPEETDERIRAERDERAREASGPSKEEMEALWNPLLAQCRREWQDALNAKRKVEEEMIEAARQLRGVYSPAKLAEIREQGGSEVYMPLTGVKARAAKAWIRDILGGARVFTISPSPVPDLPSEMMDLIRERVNYELEQVPLEMLPQPPSVVAQQAETLLAEATRREVMKEAKRRAKVAEKEIDDELAEGGWEDALEGFVSDLVDYKAGILKGPILVRERSVKYAANGVPTIEWVVRRKYVAVSPFDVYPASYATTPHDGHFTERRRFTRDELYSLIGQEGYNEDSIRAVLNEERAGSLGQWLWTDQALDDIHDRDKSRIYGSDKGLIDVLEHYTTVKASVLKEWGLTGFVDDDEEVDVCVMFCGNHILSVRENDLPNGKRPYYKASFEELRGAFWGLGLPDIMRDMQGVCNATARALVNNVGLASGPMAEVEVDRLAEGQEVTGMKPWYILQTVANRNVAPAPAVRFHNPASHAGELTQVYTYFSNLADQYTGIPAYSYGTGDRSGAGATASGLSMLMNAAGRGIKRIVSYIDKVVEQCVQATYLDMLLSGDMPEEGRGDWKIQARGSKSLMVKEQMQVRRNEFLQITANPVDMEIMGKEGRAKLLRAMAEDLLPGEELVPSDVEMDLSQALMQLQQSMMGGQSGAPGQAPPLPGGGQAQTTTTVGPDGAPAGGADMNLMKQGGL